MTICTLNRECMFGDIVNGEMRLNATGRSIDDSWKWLAEQYDHVELDEWIIMPNHLHGIIVITDGCRGGSRTAPTGVRKPIGRLVGAFKTVSTKRINEMRQTPGAKLWQRNYWEHIVRDERELNRIREYIRNNPVRWGLDRLCLCRGGSRTAPTEIRDSSPEYAMETPAAVPGWPARHRSGYDRTCPAVSPPATRAIRKTSCGIVRGRYRCGGKAAS